MWSLIPTVFQAFVGLFKSSPHSTSRQVTGAVAASILPRVKLIAAIVAILAAIGLYFYIDELRDDLALAKAENATLTIQLSSQKQKLEELSARTRQLQKDAEAWEAIARSRQEQAEKEAKKEYDKAEEILSGTAPADLSDAEAANDLLNRLIEANRR